MAVDANGNPIVSLRDIATQKGLAVDWNKEQGVLIGGTPVNTQGLTNYGIANPVGTQPDTFYGTQQQVDELLSPFTKSVTPIAPPVTSTVTPVVDTTTGATTPVDINTPPPINPAVNTAATDYETWVKTPVVSEWEPLLRPIVDNILTRTFKYDPANDAQFQQASQELTRNVMETMVSRGLLNSTITENQIQQGVSKLLPQYQEIAYNRFQDEGTTLMAQVDMLMGLDQNEWNKNQDKGANLLNAFNVVSQMDDKQRTVWQDAYTIRYNTERDKIADEQTAITNQRNAVNDAWNETDKLGYVSNAASLILGIPAGTPSQGAREATTARMQELEDSARNYAQDLEKIQIQYDNNVKLAEQSAAERASAASSEVTAVGENGLSTNAKSLLTQITADMKNQPATPENPAMGTQIALANAESKIQQALDYGMITESDAVMLAVTLGITITPEGGNQANVIAPTITGGGSKW